MVDRKTGNQRTIFVPDAYVSVTGGIQPRILRRALGVEHRESGLAARLLLSCPPRQPKRWTETEIDAATESRIAQLVTRLFDLQPIIGEDGSLCPVIMLLTPEGKGAWKKFYNEHAKEQVALNGDL